MKKLCLLLWLLCFACSSPERVTVITGSAIGCGAGDAGTGGTAGAASGSGGASAGSAGASSGAGGASAGSAGAQGGTAGASAGASSGGGSSCSTVTVAANSHSTVYWSLSPTFAHPVGAQAGDVLWLIDNKQVNNSPPISVTLPAGWTLQRRQDRPGSAMLMASHVDNGTEPATYTESVSASQYNRFAVLALRGVDPSALIADKSGAGNFAYNWTASSLNAVLDGSLWVIGFQAGTDPTNPNGLSRLLNEDQLRVLVKSVNTGATGAVNANFPPGGEWIQEEAVFSPLCTGGASGGAPGAGGSAGAPSAGAGGGSGSAGAPLAYTLSTSSLVDGPGSTHWEQGRDVAFDSAGNIVVVGGTSSPNFPTTAGAYDRVYSGGGVDGRGAAGDTDVFVSKFDRLGHMLWGTFLGGYNYDRAYAVELAANDDVIIAGRAGDGFPTTAGALQPTFAGDTDASSLYGKQDGFVARLKADGSGLVWSTYFGSTGQGIIRDMALDAAGNVYVALTGENAPLAYAPQNTSGRNTIAAPNHWNGYYGKISADGSSLLFGTFYGGTTGVQDSINPSIRVVGGDAYLVASTDATDVDCINANAYQRTNAGGADLLVMHFAADYHKVFCSYLGGAGDEVLETHVIAVQANGNIVVGGGTTSSNYPTTAGAVQTTSGGGYDGLLSVLSNDGTALLSSTYVGGSGSDGVEGLAIDASGDVLFSGSSEGGLSVTPGALQSSNNLRDAMFGRYSADLRTVRYETYFGGGLQDEFRALAVAPNGDVALAGQTESSDFPLKNPFHSTIDSSSYAPPQAVTYAVLGHP